MYEQSEVAGQVFHGSCSADQFRTLLDAEQPGTAAAVKILPLISQIREF